MSKTSIKVALMEDRFNLKTISIILILIDVFLFPLFFELNILREFLYLLLYEASLILGLMWGLRQQFKYKAMMYDLRSIASNKDISVDEREHQLVMGVHHYFLELGYIYEERNRKYGLFKSLKSTKNGSSTKKNEKIKVKNEMVEIIWLDETVWKQIGYAIAGIWFFIGAAILDILIVLDWRMLWIIMIVGIWYIIDGLMVFYIHYIFKLPQPDPKPKPPILPAGVTQPG